jgi:hypothetical protein
MSAQRRSRMRIAAISSIACSTLKTTTSPPRGPAGPLYSCRKTIRRLLHARRSEISDFRCISNTIARLLEDHQKTIRRLFHARRSEITDFRRIPNTITRLLEDYYKTIRRLLQLYQKTITSAETITRLLKDYSMHDAPKSPIFGAFRTLLQDYHSYI